MTARGFLKRQMQAAHRELEQMPGWWLTINDFANQPDDGRKECNKGHLFVNHLSKFCHICGEVR